MKRSRKLPILRQKILGYGAVVSFVVGIVSLTLDSPYWLVSVLFFLIAVLIPMISIMWKISCWADYQLQRFLRDEHN